MQDTAPRTLAGNRNATCLDKNGGQVSGTTAHPLTCLSALGNVLGFPERGRVILNAFDEFRIPWK
jgi:hypothetical protein